MNNCSFAIFVKLKLPNKSFVINTRNTKICKLPRAKQQVLQEKTIYTESLSYKTFQEISNSARIQREMWKFVAVQQNYFTILLLIQSDRLNWKPNKAVTGKFPEISRNIKLNDCLTVNFTNAFTVRNPMTARFPHTYCNIIYIYVAWM